MARERGLQLIKTLNDNKQDKFKNSTGVFKVLNKIIQLKHKEAILSLQYCEVMKWQSESAGEWMGYLRIRASQCEYEEKDRRLKEPLLNGIGDKKL